MKQQWRAAAFAVVLFFGGAAVGALAHRYYSATVVNAKTSDDYRHHYVQEMESRLKLSTVQIKELERIMDETKGKYKAVRDSYRPAMLEIKTEHTARVRSLLTAEQIPAYEQLLREREQRAKDQEERDRQEERKHANASQTPTAIPASR